MKEQSPRWGQADSFPLPRTSLVWDDGQPLQGTWAFSFSLALLNLHAPGLLRTSGGRSFVHLTSVTPLPLPV